MKTLISAEEIRAAVTQLGQTISADYAERPVTLLGVLTGCVVLLSDLIRELSIPVEISLLRASSYRGDATSPGELRIEADGLQRLAGRDVLLVDDIFDTGRTIQTLTERLAVHEPASVRSAVLLWKTPRREVPATPDYFGFQIPDVFVVGYGLDYDGRYRQLPDLAVLEADDLSGGSESSGDDS